MMFSGALINGFKVWIWYKYFAHQYMSIRINIYKYVSMHFIQFQNMSMCISV